MSNQEQVDEQEEDEQQVDKEHVEHIVEEQLHQEHVDKHVNEQISTVGGKSLRKRGAKKHVDEQVSSTSGSSLGKRGATFINCLNNRECGTRIPVEISEGGEVLCHPKFTSRLAAIVKSLVPICSFDWRKVSHENKQKIIRELERTFDWGDDSNAPKNILKHGGILHRGWRVDCKKMYFTNKPYEEAFHNPPPRVQLLEWQTACEHWAKDETKAHSERNYKNKTSAPIQTHNIGRMSIDSLQAKFAAINDGKKMDRIAVFEATHSKLRQDGTRHWIHPKYKQLHDRMIELVNSTQDEDISSCSSVDREEAFQMVMPPDRDGFIRSAGRSATKTSWYGRKVSLSAYVHKLEEQLRENRDELSQIQSQMKEQNDRLKEEVMAQRQQMQAESEQMHSHMQSQSQMLSQLITMMQGPPPRCSSRRKRSRSGNS